ncbi:MAG: hypothetical protein DWQ44_11685 [Bacteroidetes bacterium]|nr:MAG: hypothetical protein DWQ33_10650 [Bacteroidota bacterium]REK05282.1 MAG: hypothetical protein DWQ39_08815 [Bacteroidota bacterium]REK32687.1 MAG: hypothetical protein DWQ44_11685 [Bacteroidota bacterium]REK48866.1 MAG: hypothetical protein DWQ48_08275 [Bacteroidota bacterium]
MLTLNSCYYDVQEELYPTEFYNKCDTGTVTYSEDIVPILQNVCYSCHGTGVGLGGVTLEPYTALASYITDGSLLGSVTHQQGFSPMPKGGGKISDCNISKLREWIRQGAANN